MQKEKQRVPLISRAPIAVGMMQVRCVIGKAKMLVADSRLFLEVDWLSRNLTKQRRDRRAQLQPPVHL